MSETVFVPKELCDTLFARVGKKFVKAPIPVTMVQMDYAFSVTNQHGTIGGKAGDWLALDTKGETYIIEDAVKTETYRPYRSRTRKAKTPTT